MGQRNVHKYLTNTEKTHFLAVFAHKMHIFKVILLSFDDSI